MVGFSVLQKIAARALWQVGGFTLVVLRLSRSVLL